MRLPLNTLKIKLNDLVAHVIAQMRQNAPQWLCAKRSWTVLLQKTLRIFDIDNNMTQCVFIWQSMVLFIIHVYLCYWSEISCSNVNNDIKCCKYVKNAIVHCNSLEKRNKTQETRIRFASTSKWIWMAATQQKIWWNVEKWYSLMVKRLWGYLRREQYWQCSICRNDCNVLCTRRHW